MPNEWLHPSFGKFVFAAADILAGVLMYKLLVSVILPRVAAQQRSPPTSSESQSAAVLAKAPGETAPTPAPVPAQRADADAAVRRQATLLASVHLLSPLVFTISTRGSSESVLSLFVLATLYCALRARWDAAAVLLGLATHWKIYPFVYGAACLGVIGHGRGGWLRSVLCPRAVRFGLVSGATFVALGAGMYAM